MRQYNVGWESCIENKYGHYNVYFIVNDYLRLIQVPCGRWMAICETFPCGIDKTPFKAVQQLVRIIDSKLSRIMSVRSAIYNEAFDSSPNFRQNIVRGL